MPGTVPLLSHVRKKPLLADRRFSRRKKKQVKSAALRFPLSTSAFRTVIRTWQLLKGAGKHALRSCRLWRHRLAAILFYVPEDNVSRGKVIKRWYFPRNISHLSSTNSSKKMKILSRRSIAWYTLLESKGKCLSRPSICVGLQLCVSNSKILHVWDEFDKVLTSATISWREG